MTDVRLLLVDGEDHLRPMLEAALRYSGYDVASTESGRRAVEMIDEHRPDLVVLDTELDDIDGFEVCRRIRSAGHDVAVIFLSARDATEDRVHGLQVGGDDYMAKPFSLDELVARMTSVLRRSRVAAGASSVLRCADLEMIDAAHVVRRAGREVELTPTEYSLLRHLLQHQGSVLSREDIMRDVWHYAEGDGGVVETYIRYLRRKIDDVEPNLIRTVRGVGYSLRDPASGAPNGFAANPRARRAQAS